MRLPIALCIGIYALLLPDGSGQAQQIRDPGLVPAAHPVYDWLRYGRIRGWIGDFPFESRPLSRTEIGQLLQQVTERPRSRTERSWWLRFAREFAPESGLPESAALRWPWQGFDRDSVRYLYRDRGTDYALYVNLLGGPDLWWVQAPEGSSWGQIWTGGLRLRGALSGGIGFYSEARAGYVLLGEARVLRYDPFWRNLYKVRQEADRSGDVATASVSWHRARIQLDLLHGHLLYGAGQDAGLILSAQPGSYTALRTRLFFPRLRYQSALLWLLDPPRRRPFPLDTGRFEYTSIPRFLQLHRIEFIAHPRWQVAFTDLVVYGNRGIEPTYWLPFYPFVIAEHALWDRDNVLFSLESLWRPVSDLELSAAVLVDDLNLVKLGTDHMSVKLAWQLGLSFLVRSGMTAQLEYTRIEPYVYSHWIPYNSYTHNAVSLGHPLGPNGDQLYGALELWLSSRVHLKSLWRYRRHGANISDSLGRLVRNVGGDVLRGDYPPDKRKPFLDGIRQSWHEAELQASWEPWRGLWIFGRGFVRIPHRGPVEGLKRFQVGIWLEL
jgi:hypothetical protein|nr:MAG: hypothetical protein KatS3mg041_1537 [Bacteroidota bacterium]